MNEIQTYLLEELRQSDQKLRRLDELQLSLIKFYFTTAFSLATVVLGLYNFGIATDLKQSLALFLLLPSFVLGYFTNYALGRILVEYEHWETTRHQVNSFFLEGEIKKTYRLFNSPLKSFRTLVSWVATLTLFGFIYLLIPSVGKNVITVIGAVLAAIVVMGIISSIILASLNTARRRGQDAMKKSHIAQIRIALELYRDDNGTYPIQPQRGRLPRELSEYLPALPDDPEEGKTYEYSSDIDGSTYSIFYELHEEGGQVAGPK